VKDQENSPWIFFCPEMNSLPGYGFEKNPVSIFFSKGVTDEKDIFAFGRPFNAGRPGVGS
jgi:hypothetical protein